ncbi:MAG: LysM peptidoglycan-binding domain-containing protein [Betaproteobacteria bacterium]|jgi:membrane-bound lytic murein transglycosylase D|nr:LysM peptidoglycan-binding domain-containing protein [Betaproteobacteria bacterium]NDG15054.1 LysM peptidoglycan-binding domain-containing protein [Betaproteobacteria bacterium]
MQLLPVRTLLLAALLCGGLWPLAHAQTGGERPLAVQDLAPIATDDVPHSSFTPVDLPADLWERIRRGFAMPDLQVDLVQDREQWYAQRPDYIHRMTERSSKYLYHIVEEIERRGMPTELALLPFIESAFNPQAVSSARASGMWQFMPRTGKDFDLKQNAFRDDRRDVLASTRAALDYLQKLHGMFGDWHLALAAYNWGEGNVSRSLSRNQRIGAPLAYTELRMPAETRMYVPKLQAMKNVVANPQALGVNLPSIPNHPYFQTVPLPRDMDVALIARLAEVSAEDFKALNPSAHRPVMLAGGTPQILLPWDNAEIFQRNMEAYAGRLASWTVWVATKNMKVADVAKRYNMGEEEFRQINKIPPRMLIKAGSALLVPRTSHQQNDVSAKLADNGQLNLAPEVTLRKQIVKARKNDSLLLIAKRYKVSAEQVAQWNGLSVNSALRPGQKISLMLPAKPKKVKAAAQPSRKKTRP